MEQAVATTAARDVDIVPGKDLEDFVTFFIDNQMFGIPVLKVQDILTPERIAPIPLAPPEVRGSINLRGRIVTVVDVRVRLGLENQLPGKTAAAADGNAHPAQEESPDEASRAAAKGNGAAGPAEEANGSADAGERPADDKFRTAEGSSPGVDEDTDAAGVQ